MSNQKPDKRFHYLNSIHYSQCFHFCLPNADKDEVKAGKAKFLPVKKTGKGPVQAGKGRRNMCQEKNVKVEPIETYSYIYWFHALKKTLNYLTRNQKNFLKRIFE